MKKFFRRLKYFSIFLLFFGVIFGIYLFYLNYQITSKFEHHRWNLPSRVYSDSTFLFPGKDFSPKQLESKLMSLGYKKVPESKIFSPGEYHRSSRGVLLYLHNFRYPHESFEGFPLSISWSGTKISQIIQLNTREALAMIKLEPERIASLFDAKMEDRTLVKLEDVPQVLIDAIVSIEDERFYRHYGVDPFGILRAIVTDIMQRRLAQGGSTLTQQLVKNFFLTSKKSFVRKFNELWMSLLLERRYSKHEILEAYLNEIYLGQRGAASVTGVGEAARLYFAKSIQSLSIAESALLAGMIRSPGAYSPFSNLKRSRERRDFVLRTLYEKKRISIQEYQLAMSERIIVPHRQTTTVHAPHFIDLVQHQLKESFPSKTLQAEGHEIFTTLDLDLQKIAEEALSSGLSSLEAKFKSLKENAQKGKKLEAALISITPQTGYLRAYVGGRNYSKSQFNRPLQAFRQPGSAFKPFVYLAALDPETGNGKFTVASLIDDSPITLETPEGPWTPKNYDEESHGIVSMREALEMSYNIATVRLGEQVGFDNVVRTAKKAGIQSPMKAYPSVALGSFEVTPLELAEAYTIFPNGGSRSKILSIRHLITKEGDTLKTKGIKMKRIFNEGTIYLMNSLLEGVFKRGTAKTSRWHGFTGTAGGKTGTTSDYRDAWFVGYTPELLTVVWVGYDDGSSTGLTGAQAALPIWSNFMKKASNYEGALYPKPKSIIIDKVDPKTGMKAKWLCPNPTKEPFLKGTEPLATCAIH